MGCGNVRVKCQWSRRSDRNAGDGLVTLSASIMRQALNCNPEGKGKEDDLETLGIAIWKQTSKKLDAAGDNWGDWLRTGIPGSIMLAAYVTEGAMRILLIDCLTLYHSVASRDAGRRFAPKKSFRDGGGGHRR